MRSFVKYLMSYLGSETHLASKLAVQPVTRHSAPFCWLKDWELPSEFIANARFGVLQYVIIKPLLAILVFTTESRGVTTQAPPTHTLKLNFGVLTLRGEVVAGDYIAGVLLRCRRLAAL